MMEKAYIIYGKFKQGGKMFHPIDCRGGGLVHNLLYATLFDTEEQALTVMTHLGAQNPDMEFKLKKG